MSLLHGRLEGSVVGFTFQHSMLSSSPSRLVSLSRGSVYHNFPPRLKPFTSASSVIPSPSLSVLSGDVPRYNTSCPSVSVSPSVSALLGFVPSSFSRASLRPSPSVSVPLPVELALEAAKLLDCRLLIADGRLLSALPTSAF